LQALPEETEKIFLSSVVASKNITFTLFDKEKRTFNSLKNKTVKINSTENVLDKQCRVTVEGLATM
jgi:hypothetical protein